MGAFVIVALALWCFTGVLGDKDVQANMLDCSQYLWATDHGQINCHRMCSPVCGTDGITYANECELCRHNQGKNQLVGKKDVGECVKVYCKDFLPSNGSCTLELTPHCGSDGKVYGNKCNFCFNALCVAVCQQQELVPSLGLVEQKTGKRTIDGI